MKMRLCVLLLLLLVKCKDCLNIEEKTSQSLYHKLDKIYNLFFNENIHEDVVSKLPSNFNSNCTSAMNTYFSGLRNLELWALKMKEAASKGSPTSSVKPLLDFGNFEKCLDIDSVTHQIKGQYCLTGMDVDIPKITKPRHLRKLFRWALCVPDSCTAKDIRTYLMTAAGLNTVGKVNENNVLDTNFTGEEYCTPNNKVTAKENLTVTTDPNDPSAKARISNCYRNMEREIDIPSSEKEELSIKFFLDESNCYLKTTNRYADSISSLKRMVFWIFAIVIVSTLIELGYKGAKSQGMDILTSFSIRKSWKNLMDTNQKRDSMPYINGIRFICTCWIVTGHRGMSFTAMMPIIDMDVDRILSRYFHFFPFSCNLSTIVDWFFLISGMLNVYNFLKDRDAGIEFKLWKFYLHRYIRLTPVLFVVILVHLTWYEHIQSGPIWKDALGLVVKPCEDNWLISLLYLNNYVNNVQQCVPQGWYLAGDMQLFWLSPLLLIPLWKTPKKGMILTSTFLIISIFINLMSGYVQDLKSPFTLSYDFEEVYKFLSRHYFLTHTRLTPYITGIALGYVVYHIKNGKISINISKVSNIFGWLFCVFGISGISLWTAYIVLPDIVYPYNKAESLLYLSLSPVIGSLALSWVILQCVVGNGGIVDKFLSWKAFGPLSRISYCIYLCHFPVIFLETFSNNSTITSGVFGLIHTLLGDILLSLFIAIFLFLCIESPTCNLERIIFKKTPKIGKDDVNENKIRNGVHSMLKS